MRLARPFRHDDPASIRALASEYMLGDDLVYLNHASIGTVPRPVHEAHIGYLGLCERHPSLYVWGRVWRDVLEGTRNDAGSLLGCDPEDLAVTHNTTEGFNILAQGLPLGPGDEVLFSSLNHPGASVAWRGQASRRGFTVRDFDFPVARAAELTVDEVVALHVAALGRDTRALVVPHVDNMVGMVHPLPQIADAVRSRGVDFVLVDGAQSVGMIPVDIAASGVDAYAASPHKWLQSPKGLGLLWVSPALRSSLPRMWYRTAGTGIETSARQYEDYSTRAWPAVVALGDALAFQASIGGDEKVRRYRALREHLRTRVEGEARLRWRSPMDPDLASVIMAVEVSGAEAPALGQSLLAEHGVTLRAFGPPLNTLRVSPNVVTTEGELDRFLDAAMAFAG
ncbi:MAG: aminotransferase class V-fold PLP-dependent enzyme [Gemmatimonadetes bacterium]|nr:aminotransferase class V-fold PLP-dependent enzyme [Gemmatimonadota bacterium]